MRYNFTNANKGSYSFAPNGIASSVNITSQGFTISANSPGNTTLYIRYNGKEILRVYVTVNTPVKNLTVSTNNISLQNRNSSSFSITNGNGGYTVTSSNTNIAQVSGSNTSWTVKGVGIGNATITIKDSKGKSGIWNVTVTARNLTLSSYTLDVDKGVNGFITITDGNGGYSVIKKNNDISVNLSGTRVTVYSNVVGTHTLQVKDSAGKLVSFNIRVILSPLQEVQESYRVLQIMSNNGWWGDGYINEYKGKSRAQIEVQAKIFAEKLFTYKMNYDTTFKNAYNAEVNNQISKGGIKSDVERGIKEGVIEGTTDYLMSYYDTVKSLSSLSFESISNGVSAVWGFMKDPVGKLGNGYNSFKVIIAGILVTIAGFTGYEYAKGGTYLVTNLSLSAFDGLWKILKFSFDNFLIKIKGKIDMLRLSQVGKIIKNLKISQKIKNDYVSRGWSDDLIKKVIQSPYTTRKASNKATGNLATVFYQKDGSYLVVDDITFDVIQISKIGDKNWVPDSTIINPYIP